MKQSDCIGCMKQSAQQRTAAEQQQLSAATTLRSDGHDSAVVPAGRLSLLQTLQHKKFGNVFALGDCAGEPDLIWCSRCTLLTAAGCCGTQYSKSDCQCK
jgi:hypothetical protein